MAISYSMSLLTLHEKAVSILRHTVEVLDSPSFILEGLPTPSVFLIFLASLSLNLFGMVSYFDTLP